ncbi:MAG TPA: tRNA (adenosine(37)-N6)-threonylcarbamoyltransferase complex transferase subunit TsaD [Candidatus Eisenbacteria bacterium]|nr:tRNA (adenosine(37)-N6)-threonylcarbamoyltransferase complex transferase subunit TsaD [Candidatus Eisenbacteria bacterium]
MVVLGIETSCDDSAAAVLRDGRLAGSVVSSQHAVHGPYGGVVPELASREHVRHVLAVIDGALTQAGATLDDVGGIAVTRGPGLIGSILVGLSVAKGIALRRRLPLVGVNHLEGHLVAVNLDRPADDPVPLPFLALIVSGGHSGLYLARAPGDYRCLGRTRDDAVGEAFDKVAKALGLGYPGGPAIDRLAVGGDPKAVRFPRARLKRGRFDLSFSGFKTAVWQHVRANPPSEAELPDIAASVQEALVDMLVDTTVEALEATGAERLVVSGGVSANRRLRERMTAMGAERGVEVLIPRPALCTDNAAMIALAGWPRLAAGEDDGPGVEADAALPFGAPWAA